MKTAAQKYSESNAEAILAYFRGVDGTFVPTPAHPSPRHPMVDDTVGIHTVRLSQSTLAGYLEQAFVAGERAEFDRLEKRALQDAIATGHEEEDGWIRTDERMPDTRGEIGHSLPVLIYKPHNACCFLAVWAGFYGWQDWTNQSQHAEKEVSHWRSLPESPDGIGEPDGLYKFEETP